MLAVVGVLLIALAVPMARMRQRLLGLTDDVCRNDVLVYRAIGGLLCGAQLIGYLYERLG
ncbi:MAG: hypothetical protein ACYC7C_11980 [Coriobacteriia bacterium]